MTRDELLRLCDELWELVKMGPGTNPQVKSRVDEILRRIASHGDPTTYLREKMFHVRHDFDIWLTPRRWQRWGKDCSHFQSHVYGSVGKLKGAIESRLAWVNEPPRPLG